MELYKTAVDTQIHFNDIEWKIRGLALTVITFTLGAAAYAGASNERVWCVSTGSVISLIGVLLWYAFYFVDRHWYHPLLKGSVSQGREIEKQIAQYIPSAGMTARITEFSVYRPGRIVRTIRRKDEMHSDDKLVWFYAIGASTLIAFAVILEIAVFVRK